MAKKQKKYTHEFKQQIVICTIPGIILSHSYQANMA